MKHARFRNFIDGLAAPARADGGYVLIYALIMTAVLTAVVLGVFSVSLSNLKAQQQSVEDMQARYRAEGCVEMVVAKLDDYIRESAHTYTPTDPEELQDTSLVAAQGTLHAAIVGDVEDFLDGVNASVSDYEIASVKKDGGDTAIEITMEAAPELPAGVDAIVTIPLVITGENVTISTTLEYELVFIVEQGDELGTPSLGQPQQYEYDAHAEVKGVPEYKEYKVAQSASN